ncbi:MAG: HlyD family efflux transporter periplasmic adaptor subunit [Limnothrix sp. BL-A-16]|jgi:HlyD family secretion protein
MLKAFIEREEQPVLLQRPALLASGFIWLIVTFVVGGITWAAVAQIDQSVPAAGKLQPKDSTKPIKAPAGGVVREIVVKDGERVEKGQLLATFDPTGQAADVQSLKANQDSLERQKQLIRAEAAGLGLTREGQASIIDLQRNRAVRVAENIYLRALLRGDRAAPAGQAGRLAENRAAQASRLSQLQSRVSELNSQINELRSDVANTRAQRRAIQIRLGQAQERLNINEGIIADLQPLVEEGAVARLQFKNQQQAVLSNADAVATLEGQIASLNEQEARLMASIQTKQAEIGTQLAEIRTTQTSWAADLENRIADNDRAIADIDTQLAKSRLDNRRQDASVVGQLAQVQSQLVKAEQAVRYQELRAPIAGTVFDIKASGPGYVASPTEPMLSIVPDGELVASVYVTNKDIGFVEVGMPVEVSVDTFPSLEFGSIKGKLVSIGSDALAPTQERPTYTFPIRIELERQTLKTNRGLELKIQAGMSVSARIKTRKRSVLDIFLGQFKSRADSFETVR